MNLTNEQTLILIGVGGALVYLVATRGLSAINPVATENVFYQGVNAVGDVFTDGEPDNDFNLGVALHNLITGGDARVVDGRVEL